jgi:hypothetical protein
LFREFLVGYAVTHIGHEGRAERVNVIQRQPRVIAVELNAVDIRAVKSVAGQPFPLRPCVVMQAREHAMLLAKGVIHARHINVITFENFIRLKIIVAPLGRAGLIRQRIKAENLERDRI